MSTWIRKKRTQQRMLQMSAISNPSLFYYKGPIEGFKIKLNQHMSNPNAQITDVHVVIAGNQTKDPNYLCCILTGFLGFLLFFPWIVMCCEWWTKMVEPAFELPLDIYHGLMGLIKMPTVKSVNLEVIDNAFNNEKAKLIFNNLSASEVKDFTFYNSGGAFDYKDKQWSNFVQNMKPIKMLPMNTYIRWYNKIVQ